LDPSLALTCIKRALELVVELNCGDVVPGLVDNYPTPSSVRKLNFDPVKIANHIGIDIDLADISAILKRLEIKVEGSTATIPTFRPDITIWHDLAEEVARLYGYERIPAVVASSSNVGVKTPEQLMMDKLTDIMIMSGYSQMLTYAFESPRVFDKLLIPQGHYVRDAVRIINPLGEETSIMRTSTINSILTALTTNHSRRNPQVRLFELAKRYAPAKNPNELPTQEQMLVFGGSGDMDFYDIKAVVESIVKSFGVTGTFAPARPETKPFMHPGQVAVFTCDDGTNLAFLGKVHPIVAETYEISHASFIAVLNFDKLQKVANMERSYKTLPKYPATTRDIAIVVKNDVLHGQLEATIKKAGGKYLRQVNLFDIYTGDKLEKEHKSMAYALVFRADDRTLTDIDATKAMDKILTALQQEHSAQLRS